MLGNFGVSKHFVNSVVPIILPNEFECPVLENLQMLHFFILRLSPCWKGIVIMGQMQVLFRVNFVFKKRGGLSSGLMTVKDFNALSLNILQSFDPVECMIQNDPKVADYWNLVSFSILKLELGQLQPGLFEKTTAIIFSALRLMCQIVTPSSR